MATTVRRGGLGPGGPGGIGQKTKLILYLYKLNKRGTRREHEHTSMVAAKYGEKLTCCPSLLPLTPYLSHPYSYSVIRKQNK